MAETKTYAQQQTIKYTKKLNELLKILPSFCTEYFNSLEYSKQPRTRVAYAMDIKGFFEFLICEYPQYANYTVKDFTLADLEKLKGQDISDYLRYVKLYDKEGKEVSNSERAAKRKLCALRRFYAYYYRYEMIGENPTLKVDMPKIHGKTITRLDTNEIADFLDAVEYGDHLTKHQQAYHAKTKVRDLAILTLMLGTGIRVSECVGIDLKDVDFNNSRVKVTRKGGYESYVYFGDEVTDALTDYLEERKHIEPVSGYENALFLSSQKKRMSVRSVEMLVKKYSEGVIPLKHITPHKLRSTYGTELYRETGDIYLVADVLGHSDVNTTRKHYADMDEDRRRSARNRVQLREKRDD